MSRPNNRSVFLASKLCMLLSILFLCAGCEIDLPWAPKKDAKAAEADKAQQKPAEEEATAEEETTPPDESALLPGEMKTLPYEEVSITLPDQLVMYGRLYDPSLTSQGENEFEDPEGYEGKKYPLVILLHGLNRSHLAWSDMPSTLVKAGYAVFALDLRGHGKSTVTTGKRRATWRYLKPEQWRDLHKDINKVIEFFKKGEDYPEVDGSQVALIGEKLGANIATFAAQTNADIKSLILISPGLEFKGIDASRGLLDYGGRTLILTNHDYVESHRQAQHLYNWITGSKTLQVYEKIGEGADMITGQPGVQQQITQWLLKGIPTPGASVPAETPESESTSNNSAEAKKHSAATETPQETGYNSPAAKKAIN